jgi:antitoxin HicB
MPTLKELLKLPYSHVLIPNEAGDGYVAHILEFPGCHTQGETAEEALEHLEEAKLLWLEEVIAAGQSVPEPIAEGDHSGKLVFRMPKTVHRAAAARAQAEGVSLNQWLLSAVNQRLGAEDAVAAIIDRLRAAGLGVIWEQITQRFILLPGSLAESERTSAVIMPEPGKDAYSVLSSEITPRKEVQNR